MYCRSGLIDGASSIGYTHKMIHHEGNISLLKQPVDISLLKQPVDISLLKQPVDISLLKQPVVLVADCYDSGTA